MVVSLRFAYELLARGKEILPEEDVANEAAMQNGVHGGIADSILDDVILIDVTPLSLCWVPK
jgi:molecular chaperone DnaK (HSP70)